MVTGSDSFSSDYQALQETLKKHNDINIISTEGTPPKKYEIEYGIPGYIIQTDGEIGQADSHRIAINLPLGYPRTPPIVKTLTATYHPEIDDNTVHIAHYWLKNSSLPDLVVHIGKMIGGEIYNTEAPHNKQALEWFLQNKEQLPLTSRSTPSQSGLTERDIELVDSVLDSSYAESSKPTDSILDILDDESLQQAEFAKEEISTAIKNKKLFTAQRLLDNLGANLQQTDKNKFRKVIDTAIKRVNELVEQANDLEEQDEFKEALSIIKQIPGITSDFPGFSDIQSRLSHSIDLAHSLNAFEEKKQDNRFEDIQEGENNKSDSQATKPQQSRINLPQLQIPKIRLPELPYLRIVIVSTILVCIILPTYFYFKDRSILKRAEKDWNETQNLIKQNKFKQALESAEDIKAYLSDITLLQNGQHELLFKIDNVLLSKNFTEGLHGKILYNGDYIETDKFFKIKKLEALIQQADELEQQGQTKQAIRAYDKARLYATNNALGPYLNELQDKINKIQLEQILQIAQKAEQNKQWDTATNSYQKALAVVHNLSSSNQDQATVTKINQALASASFKEKLIESRESMASEDWRQTVRLLQLAEEIMIANPEVIPAVEQREVATLLADSQLQLLLGEAKETYENGKWETSVKKYQEALQLLSEKEGLFSQNIDRLASQIEHTVLMTRIAGEQSRVAVAEKNKDPDTALTHYYHIVNLINQSKFKHDKKTQQILNNTLSQIEASKIQAKIKDKVAWLEKRHALIFKKYYPYVQASKLLYPKVNFVGEKNGNMIFELSCIEKSQGRPSRLVLNYEYDTKTGHWHISNDHL